MAGIDAHRTAGHLAQVYQHLHALIEFVKTVLDVLKQAAAGLGKRQFAGGADEQLHAQPHFQMVYGSADPRLCHAQFGCRLGKAAFAGNQHKSI